VQTTPDTSCSLCSAFYGASFEGLYLCTRRVEKKLDFFVDGGKLETIEWDDFIAVVDIKAADDRFFVITLFYDNFDMRVDASERLEVL